MERICQRFIKTTLITFLSTALLLLSACAGAEGPKGSTPAAKDYTAEAYESPEELYQKALREDVLIIYTVSTRVTETKEAFEKAYPGLSVEIRDLRSPNLIEEVAANDAAHLKECDVVLCNDNSGDFKSRLVDTGIVKPYLPSDIATHMKDSGTDGIVSFLYEAELLFYNSALYEECPIKNIWELTEPKWQGRIYMSNPLRSFSTYAFCASTFAHDEALLNAYREYAGKDLSVPDGSSAAALFWTMLSDNIIYTNSSDEVTEALGSNKADFGIAVSSKLRMTDLGYPLAPVYHLNPFCGCKASFAVMLAREPRSENCAKLFVRFLLGEADGSGDGYKPFCTLGTWSARDDVPDGNPVPWDDIDLITPDQDTLIMQKSQMEAFWSGLLKQATPDQ